MIRGPLASAESATSSDPRIAIARWIAAAMSALNVIAFPLSIVGWLLLVARSIVRRRFDAGHVIVASLAAAIAARLAMLVILDATTMPSISALYLSPILPVVAILAPCVFFLARRA
jgi:hypothetical protein